MKFKNVMIISLIALLLGIIIGERLILFPHTKQIITHTAKHEEEVPFTEDLMIEHGLLNRLLLIYEDCIKRLNNGTFKPEPLSGALTIMHDFFGNYHEKMEEKYIFPLFEKNNLEVDLVKELREQHKIGRKITVQLKQLVHKTTDSAKKDIACLLQELVTMYRPHEAREDTEIFSKVRSLINEQEFNELSEKFEKSEHELFGEEGFSGIEKKVDAIEKILGIYTIKQFSP